jgi:hypothetical protein
MNHWSPVHPPQWPLILLNPGAVLPTHFTLDNTFLGGMCEGAPVTLAVWVRSEDSVAKPLPQMAHWNGRFLARSSWAS